MRATTACVCFTILVSFALTIVGFPENSVRYDGETIPEHQLTDLNLTAPAAIEGSKAIPIYNPAISLERHENHRAKRHLKKKGGGGGGRGGGGGYQQQQQQQQTVVVVNQHPQQQPSRGCNSCGQPVQNTGWGWGR